MDFIVFLINFLFSIYYILLVLRALLPWLPKNWQVSWLSPINILTDPLLLPIRLGLPPERIGMDVSPFVLLILLIMVQNLIKSILGG